MQTLFFSPVAWFILVIFAFQAAIVYISVFDDSLMKQELGHEGWQLTAILFSGRTGVFPTIQNYLYLYIPLLTMGLMSREVSSGSIKLLYSSPVKVRHIIFGKYIAMAVYGLTLILILMAFVLFSACTVKDFDFPAVMSGILGIYLLICAYSAIGLFMSCLLSYQVAVAIGTLVVLAALNYVGGIGQEIAFVREITYWLSISGRTNEFLSGLICSEDVCYFLIVIALFLALSILRIRSEKQGRGVWRKYLSYAGVFLAAMLCGYVSSRPQMKCYKDTTCMKSRTLIPQGEEIMKHLEGGLTITTYVNLLDRHSQYAFPHRVMRDMATFRDYIRFKPEIKMKYIYYYDDGSRGANPELEKMARRAAVGANTKFKYFISPEKMGEVMDLEPEGYRFVRLIERENGQKTLLRIFNDLSVFPGEAEILAAFKKVSVPLPKVGFLTGHGERSIHSDLNRDYYRFSREPGFRRALINQGFDVEEVSVGERGIPEDIDILVVADPKRAFPEDDSRALLRYISSGKNLLLAGDVGGQEYLNPLLSSLGVKMLPGLLVQPHEDELANVVLGGYTGEATAFSRSFSGLKKNGYGVAMSGVVGLAYTTDRGYEVLPVLRSDSTSSWNRWEKVNFLEDTVVFNPLIGEEKRNYPVVLMLSRVVDSKEQRILITGDADFLATGEMNVSRKGIPSAPYFLIDESFNWLSNGQVPISVGRTMGPDTFLYFRQESLPFLKAGFMGVLPGILAISGVVIWLIRRRR